MIGVSVILVALVSSVAIGIVVVLWAFLVVRLTKSIVRRVRDALRRVEASERSFGKGQPTGVGDDERKVSVHRTVCVVGCLVAASVLELVGMFLPLYHFHFPGRAGSTHAVTRTISSYSSTPYHALTSWVSLATLVMLAYFAARRRDRITAAIIVGYSALTLGSFVTFVAGFTVRRANLGSGYYLLGAGSGAQVVALMIAIGIFVTGRPGRGRVTVRGVWLGVLAALVGGATSVLNPVKFFGQSVWAWSGLPWQYSIGLVAALLALVLVPLAVLRAADRAAACMALGLAAALALSATESLLLKRSHPSLSQLTVGFWLTTFGVVMLVLLALALTKPFVQRPASTPMPVSVRI